MSLAVLVVIACLSASLTSNIKEKACSPTPSQSQPSIPRHQHGSVVISFLNAYISPLTSSTSTKTVWQASEKQAFIPSSLDLISRSTTSPITPAYDLQPDRICSPTRLFFFGYSTVAIFLLLVLGANGDMSITARRGGREGRDLCGVARKSLVCRRYGKD